MFVKEIIGHGLLVKSRAHDYCNVDECVFAGTNDNFKIAVVNAITVYINFTCVWFGFFGAEYSFVPLGNNK